MLEQEAGPDAGPVGRVGEQARHRGRRHFHGRRRALAGPAPARTADDALVGLDLDLDEGGFLGAVRRVGLPAPCAHARIGRRVVLFGALLEPGPLGAAVAGRAALLAALALRARFVLLLALAPEQLLRQHGPRRAQLRKLGLQRLEPAARTLHGLAQPGVLLTQHVVRRLLAPRPPQRRATVERPRRTAASTASPRPPGASQSGPSTFPSRPWTPSRHGAAGRPPRSATGPGLRARPVPAPPD